MSLFLKALCAAVGLAASYFLHDTYGGRYYTEKNRQTVDGLTGNLFSDGDRNVLVASFTGLPPPPPPTPEQLFDDALMASRERIHTKYPALAEGPHHDALIAYVTAQQAKPERQAFFQRPDYPELIGEEYVEYVKYRGAIRPENSRK